MYKCQWRLVVNSWLPLPNRLEHSCIICTWRFTVACSYVSNIIPLLNRYIVRGFFQNYNNPQNLGLSVGTCVAPPKKTWGYIDASLVESRLQLGWEFTGVEWIWVTLYLSKLWKCQATKTLVFTGHRIFSWRKNGWKVTGKVWQPNIRILIRKGMVQVWIWRISIIDYIIII